MWLLTRIKKIISLVSTTLCRLNAYISKKSDSRLKGEMGRSRSNGRSF